MSGTGGYGGRDDERRRDLDQAMHVGLCRTRRQMIGDHGDGLLDKVEVEHLLVKETTTAFARAVAEARAADFTWEQITQRVPGLVRTFGPQAAERLFEMVAVVGSRPGGRYTPWRCGECDGLVRDYGPYGGHPGDMEPGHRGDCDRQTIAVWAYEASLEADGQRATTDIQTVPHDGCKSAPRLKPSGLKTQAWSCDARARGQRGEVWAQRRPARATERDRSDRHQLAETGAAHESS